MRKTASNHSPKYLFGIDWILGSVVTAAAVLLHLVFLNNVGALWRDESGIVSLATLPTFAEMWSYLHNDAFPLLFPAAIRFWTAIGLGGADGGLRAYGFLVGIILLGAVWLNGWALTRSVPLISLGLLATNITVIRWGDSLRAYGIGSVMILLTVAFMWRFVARPGHGRWFLGLLTAVASVHCLYQNAFMVLAICTAGAAVCLQRKDLKSLAAVFALGLITALSLLPYVKTIREATALYPLEQTGFNPALAWPNLLAAMAGAMPWTQWLWLMLGLLAVGRGIYMLSRGQAPNESPESQVVLYATTALITGVIAFFIYFWLSALPPMPWYFLPLVTFVPVCIDAALTTWLLQFRPGRWLILCLAAAIPYEATFDAAKSRFTNIDSISAILSVEAGPQDLILVHPWFFAISFDRYFKGETPWMTIPQLADHRFHRYDLVKSEMQLNDPIQPALDKIASTLQAGHRVWIVGWVPLDKTPPPPDLGPAPNVVSGWHDWPYWQAWGATAGYLLATHARQTQIVPIQSFSNYVAGIENLPVMVVAGWQAQAHPTTQR